MSKQTTLKPGLPSTCRHRSNCYECCSYDGSCYISRQPEGGNWDLVFRWDHHEILPSKQAARARMAALKEAEKERLRVEFRARQLLRATP